MYNVFLVTNNMSGSDKFSVTLASSSNETESDLSGAGRTVANVLSRLGRTITPSTTRTKKQTEGSRVSRRTHANTGIISMTRSSETASNLPGHGRTLDVFLSTAGKGLSNAINRTFERAGWGPNNIERDIIQAEEKGDAIGVMKLCSNLLLYIKSSNTNNQHLAIHHTAALLHRNASRRKVFIELGAQPILEKIAEKASHSNEKGRLRHPALIALAELDDSHNGPNVFFETFVTDGRVWQPQVTVHLRSLLNFLSDPDIGRRSIALDSIQYLCQKDLLYALMLMSLDADQYINSSTENAGADGEIDSFVTLIQQTMSKLQVATGQALLEDYNAEWRVNKEESGSPGEIHDDLRRVLCSAALNLFRSSGPGQHSQLVHPLTRLAKKMRKNRRELLRLGAPAILEKALTSALSENDLQTIRFSLDELEFNSPDALFSEFEEEWLGLGQVARVIPQHTLDVLCHEMLQFLKSPDLQIQLSTIRNLQAIAIKDRYCWKALHQLHIIRDLKTMAEQGPPAVASIAASTNVSLESAYIPRQARPPTWSAFSDDLFCPFDAINVTNAGTARLFSPLFAIRARCPGGCWTTGDSEHMHIGMAGIDERGEIPLLLGVESDGIYSPTSRQWLIGDSNTVRWLDIPRGNVFRVGDHKPVVAGVLPSGEIEYVACGLGRGVAGDNHIGGWYPCSIVDGARNVNIPYAYRAPGRTEITDTFKVLVLSHDFQDGKEA